MKKHSLLLLPSISMLGFLLPESPMIPVSGATSADWNPKSFWYYPWGRSGTHKGIDIFARTGTPVLAASAGWVLHTGVDSLGGNIVLVLGAKWRFHYYAHLHSIQATRFQWVSAGDALGTVGSTGNAQGKPPHLHYAIRTLLPQTGQYDAKAPQAWQKMFYINPQTFLTRTDNNT